MSQDNNFKTMKKLEIYSIDQKLVQTSKRGNRAGVSPRAKGQAVLL
jgi:hypothetical protein